LQLDASRLAGSEKTHRLRVDERQIAELQNRRFRAFADRSPQCIEIFGTNAAAQAQDFPRPVGPQFDSQRH